MTNEKTPDSAASVLSAGLGSTWHHPECDGKCMACLLEATVLENYGTQGLDFLRSKVGVGGTANDSIDAKRYRWLREQKASGGGYWVAHGRINGGLSQWYGDPLDKAIDAALMPNVK